MKRALPILLASLLCAHAAESPSWASKEELASWEKAALAEIAQHKSKAPEKEFLLYLIAGRELAAHGLIAKSREYYLKAFEHPSKSDKSEAVVQLLALAGRAPADLARAKAWFSAHAEHRTPELDRWLSTMEGHLQGQTPIKDQGYLSTWALDSRVSELMKEGKAQEAYQLLGPRQLKEADINQRVRQDLLAAIALGKKTAPPLWCKPTLLKYPQSLTWSMRVCRYLDDWKAGRKSRESIQSVKEQLQKENPERLYWAKLLERL